MTQLTRKSVPFRWTDLERTSFLNLKERVTQAPVLAHFDRTRKTVAELDSSDYVNGGVLSQVGDDGELHPVAYFSKTMLPAECNYEIYDKELLAIIRGFEAWEPELMACEQTIDVVTDHRALEYFMSTKKLSRRQVRWAELLSQFDFKIVYRPGRLNERADALSRRSQDKPTTAADARNQHQMQTMLKPEMLSTEVKEDLHISSEPNKGHAIAPVETSEGTSPIEDIWQANKTSPLLYKLREQAQEEDSSYKL